MNKLTEEEKDRQVEQEVQTAILIANKLFKVVTAKDFVKEVPDPQVRLDVVNKQLNSMDEASGTSMYKSFGNAYPIVLKYMVQKLSYSSKAFEKFIRKQAEDPGKGMEGFITHQANYVYYLCIELGKKSKKKNYMKDARQARKQEFELMDKVRKDMEKKEKETRNEFEEESTKHLDEKRDELLEFINQELKGVDIPDDEDSDSDNDESTENSDDEEQSEEPFETNDSGANSDLNDSNANGDLTSGANSDDSNANSDLTIKDNFDVPVATEGMTEEEFRATLSPADRAAREETDRFLADLDKKEQDKGNDDKEKKASQWLVGTIADPTKKKKRNNKNKRRR